MSMLESLMLVNMLRKRILARSASSSSPTESFEAANINVSQSNRTAPVFKRLLGDDDAPQVLLAITFEGEHWLKFEHSFASGFKDVPVPTRSINIEAVFRGLSTMTLLSMPMLSGILF